MKGGYETVGRWQLTVSDTSRGGLEVDGWWLVVVVPILVDIDRKSVV